MSSLKFGSRCVAGVIPKSSISCLKQKLLRNLRCSAVPIHPHGLFSASQHNFTFSSSSSSVPKDYPLSGLEDVTVSYIFGKKRVTEVAHLVWKHVLRKGDTVIDATCGNGYDTLAMIRMVADESGVGRVYAIDIQKEALGNTSALLQESLNQKEKQLVKLFPICHSRMEEIVPDNCPVRLIAFNLGFLPGGDKTVTTKSVTTLQALEAAARILIPGGLISLVVYVGHPGGAEEWETIQNFTRKLPVENWVCCKFEMLNRPLAPVLVFLFKR